MYAALVEVDVSGVDPERGIDGLRHHLVPAIASMPGFLSGTWLMGGSDGRGLSLTVWSERAAAQAFADQYRVGVSPQAGASVARSEVRAVAATA